MHLDNNNFNKIWMHFKVKQKQQQQRRILHDGLSDHKNAGPGCKDENTEVVRLQ